MNNIDDRLEKLVGVTESNAYSIKSLEHGMGIIDAEVKGLKNEQRLMKSDVEDIKKDLKTEIETREYNEKMRAVMDAGELSEIKGLIKTRVTDLLRPLHLTEFDFNKYFGKFTQRCINDCKNKNLMARTKGGWGTLKINEKPLKEFIESWMPESFGTAEGYINHLNALEAERNKNYRAFNF